MSQTNEPSRTRRRSQADIEAGFTGEGPRYSSSGYDRRDQRGMVVPDADTFTGDDTDYLRLRSSTMNRQDTFHNPPQRRPPTTPRTSAAAQGRPSMARDYMASQRRTTRDDPQLTPSQRKPSQFRRMHWLLPVGLTLVAIILLWVISSSVLAWGTQMYNNIRYGYPRTFQTDAVVGHNDSKTHPSHFIAINLNHQVVIEEFMGGDPTKVVTYIAPVYIAGAGGDLAPVTLQFRDVNGDGKPDMIVYIHLPSQVQTIVFINTGSKFRPATASDKIQLNQ